MRSSTPLWPNICTLASVDCRTTSLAAVRSMLPRSESICTPAAPSRRTYAVSPVPDAVMATGPPVDSMSTPVAPSTSTVPVSAVNSIELPASKSRTAPASKCRIPVASIVTEPAGPGAEIVTAPVCAVAVKSPSETMLTSSCASSRTSRPAFSTMSPLTTYVHRPCASHAA